MQGQILGFDDDLMANLAKGDQLCAKLKGGLDLFIEKTGTEAPPPEADPADVPFEGLEAMASVRELELEARGIKSVVWATGFGPKFDYLDPSLLDERGLPRHQGGLCERPPASIALACSGSAGASRDFLPA